MEVLYAIRNFTSFGSCWGKQADRLWLQNVGDLDDVINLQEIVFSKMFKASNFIRYKIPQFL